MYTFSVVLLTDEQSLNKSHMSGDVKKQKLIPSCSPKYSSVRHYVIRNYIREILTSIHVCCLILFFAITKNSQLLCFI